MHLLHPKPRPDHGLTRNEWLWTLLLLFVIVATIVGTLDSEVEKGNLRMANDHLSYLASQIYLGLETDTPAAPSDMPLPLLGPGLPPEGLPSGGAEPGRLKDWMMDGSYIPVDPWDNGYVLMLGQAGGGDALFIVSGGVDGSLPETANSETPLARRVHWPFTE